MQPLYLSSLYFYRFYLCRLAVAVALILGVNSLYAGEVPASNPGDYFRSATSGNWSSASSWQSSADNISWSAATLAPTSAAASVTVRNGHTITLAAAASAKLLTIETGAVLTNTDNGGGGFVLTIANDAGVDMKVFGVFEMFGVQPTFLSGAIGEIYSGGVVRASNNTSGSSDDFARRSDVTFFTDAVFDWNTANSFEFSGDTYFPTAGANIPIFRVSQTPGTPGGGTASTINGMLEVNASFTFIGGSAKTFRNGISGTATLTQNTTSGNSFNITAANAVLGGTGLNLSLATPINLGTSTIVPAGKDVTVSGANITNPGILTINGTMDVTTIRITNTGTVQVNGIYKTANTGGFTGAGSSIPGGTVILNNSTSTVEYYLAGNQPVVSRADYFNLLLSGSGTKTPSSSFSPAGTVTISGSVIFDCTSRNIGSASTNLTMTGGRLILSTTGTQPSMGGVYNITGGVVQFNGSNVTSETIRNRTYQNIEVTGNNVGNSSGNITLNNLGTFTVKTGGVFTINDNTITGPTGSQTVTVENGATFRCGNNEGFNGFLATFTNNSSVHADIETISLNTGSTVEYMRGGDQPITAAGGLIYHHLSLSGSGNKTAPALLTVKGNFTNSSGAPVFVHNNGTVLFSGTSAQGFNALSEFKFYNITVSNPVNLIMNSNLSLVKQLSLSSGSKLQVAALFTLLSSLTNTANIDKIPTANSITYSGAGKFVVERYVPTGVLHGKSWQILAVPTHGFNESVNAAWQESNLPLSTANSPLYGTTLSSEKAGAVSRGYDFHTPAGASIRTYDANTNSWVSIDDGVTNTNALPILNKKGYLVLVRGNRSVQTYNAPANETTLRTRGRVYAPGADAPPSTTVMPQKFESIGNPYASAIDFHKVHTQSPLIGEVQDVFYVWDPYLTGSYGLGAFQTFIYNSSTMDYDVVPGQGNSANNRYIQSGQAFFVASAPGGSTGGTVSFTEDCKVSSNSVTTRPIRPFTHPLTQLKVTLSVVSGGQRLLLDGVLSQFSSGFSKAADKGDALKLHNSNENLSIMRDGSQLSVERTTMPGINDTIFYHTSGLRKQQYSIKLIPENFRNGFEAVMHDRYQGMSWTINLSDSTEISFTVTDEAASAAPNRFMLVFNRQLPATNFGDEVSLPKENMFTVMPNPVTGKVLRLQFNNDEGGRYQVSLLSQSGQVVNSTSVFLNKGKSVQSLAVGNIPAGTYLLKVATAETIYTKVIVIL